MHTLEEEYPVDRRTRMKELEECNIITDDEKEEVIKVRNARSRIFQLDLAFKRKIWPIFVALRKQ